MTSVDWGEPPIDLEGNKPAALGFYFSRESHLASNWIVAIDAWDYCDDSLLTEMLRRHPIPFELQPVIADIVAGKRKQNKKAAAKLKIPAAHRMLAAGLYGVIGGVLGGLLDRSGAVEIGGKMLGDYHATADERGLEVAEMRQQIQQSRREWKEDVADAAGISVDTLENLYEELKRKLKNYPNI